MKNLLLPVTVYSSPRVNKTVYNCLFYNFWFSNLKTHIYDANIWIKWTNSPCNWIQNVPGMKYVLESKVWNKSSSISPTIVSWMRFYSEPPWDTRSPDHFCWHTIRTPRLLALKNYTLSCTRILMHVLTLNNCIFY